MKNFLLWDNSSISLNEGVITLDPKHFVKQNTYYSCGGACLAVVASLYGKKDLSHETCDTLLNCRPVVGTEQNDLLAVAKKHFPNVTGGSNTYTGGLAIASIIHFTTKPEGSGHYVVFLGVRDAYMHYFCPWINGIVKKPLREIIWHNTDADYVKWSVNFDYPVAGN